MNDTLEPVTIADLSIFFQAMVDQMKLNGNGPFGGAFVVVPPRNGGDPVQTLILDAAQQPAQFWSILKTRCDIELQRIDELARNQQAFRR